MGKGDRQQGRLGAWRERGGWYRIALLLLTFSPSLPLVLSLTGCATPIAPTGGPADTTPPRLEAAEPAPDTTNVRPDRLTLLFSEPVEESSLRQALAITPGFETPPEVRVRGRRAEVLFPEPLREHTTYVVTLGTELRDFRTVALRSPITLAFSTGPTLDRGRIAGTVRDPRSGAAISGIDVFAYPLTDTTALPDPRAEAPVYRTQTGEGGAFALSYLREAPFFVVAVADRNRNRRADPGEAFAVPYEPVVRAAPDTAEVPELRLFRTQLDTLPPEPLRLRPLSDRRHAVRFTEPIRLRSADPAAWALLDSTTGTPATVEAVYADTDPQQLILRTAPLRPVPHQLWLNQPAAVTDTVGNPARTDPLSFTPSADADTLQLRFLGFEPEGEALLPRARPVLRFTQPADSAILAERIAVTDTAGAALPFTLTRDLAGPGGPRYRIDAETSGTMQVAVQEPDSLYTRTLRPLPPDELGDLTGVITTDGPVVVEIVPATGEPYVVETDTTGAYAVRGLPEGEVRLRVFVDDDGDGMWDGGHLAPYAPPEPLLLVPNPQRIRARWETVVDSLAIE